MIPNINEEIASLSSEWQNVPANYILKGIFLIIIFVLIACMVKYHLKSYMHCVFDIQTKMEK